MRDFRKIKVWEKSHQLTLEVYKITKNFPPDERFGLTSQMRRSSSSIPTNIAEGCGRQSEAELKRFMEIGMGSASELEYQLLLSKDLGYLKPNSFGRLTFLTTEVKKMLSSFIVKLR